MIQRLQALQRPWQLFYAARSRSRAAFMDELEHFDATLRTDSTREDGHQWGHAHFHMDRQPGQRLDVAAIVRDAAPGSHFYCCGPASLLETFQDATRNIPPERIHLEYFAGATQQPAAERAFTVILAKSGCEVEVPPGTSILDALLDAGVRVDFACREGVCGTCETRVLEGTPDHRDMILSQPERDAGKTMMICCSGSKTSKLTLDC
jgi:vanillate O-demethylase ferredoxin subunit